MRTKFTSHAFPSLIGGIFCLMFASFVLETQALGAEPVKQADRPWQAQWIWSEVECPNPFQFVRFRKTVKLSTPPEHATVFITADTFYRLWINDQLVMHGPARSSRGKVTVDVIDTTAYLHQGPNAIRIEAMYGGCPFEALGQAPGMFCELEIVQNGNRTVVAASDNTWEAAEIAAWDRNSIRFSYQRGWIEQFDARQTLEEKWRPAKTLGPVGMAPWRKVELRDVPLPAPLRNIVPTSLRSVDRSDGFAGTIEPIARFEPHQPEWEKQGKWLRRLQTEHLRPDASAADNPEGVTARGQGDAVLKGDGASLSYDLGLGYVGFVGFEVTGHAGQVLDIAWSEYPADDGSVRPRQFTEFNNAIRYTLREGRQSFLAFMPQFARLIRVVQRGEGTIALHKLGITEFRFIAEPNGGFECSDDALNRIYAAGARTAMLVTLDAYMDCPNRERNGMYGVEAYWAEKTLYPAFGDTSVSRRSVVYGADSVEDPKRVGPPGLVQLAYPMDIDQYHCIIPLGPFFWVLHAGLYERCSEDVAFMRSMIPVMRRNLDAFDITLNDDGLIETFPKEFQPCWQFFDWADIRTDQVSIACNAVYVKALNEAARLERLAGDASHAEDFERRAQRARNAINRYCAGTTYYPDVLFRNDKKELVPSEETSETTQYYAMWCGVPDAERMNRMWRGLRDDFAPTPWKKQPIQGLTRAGLYTFSERLEIAASMGDHAALIRDAKGMFLPMVDNMPGTLWESPDGRLVRCHAIACGVSGILTETILGIRLGTPIVVAPHNAGSLQWCKGFITTPQGRIEVRWECRKDRYELRVAIPKNTTAEVLLPPEAKAVWQAASSTSAYQDTIPIHNSAVITVEPGRLDIQ